MPTHRTAAYREFFFGSLRARQPRLPEQLASSLGKQCWRHLLMWPSSSATSEVFGAAYACTHHPRALRPKRLTYLNHKRAGLKAWKGGWFVGWFRPNDGRYFVVDEGAARDMSLRLDVYR